ncbi:MAG: response regulator [Candidatus Pacebacteria bacterium]|nr:response regulator [Candidatus Paceibacterota bacterium]
MPKVLVVEDDKFLRELINRKLQSENFETFLAFDGETALVLVEKERPDIVLLDLILPGINGFEVLAKIKENERLKEIPVIILSNLGQKDDIDKGMGLGATDYLVKAHFTPSEIIEKINQTLTKTSSGGQV